jgi:hypothetical protein
LLVALEYRVTLFVIAVAYAFSGPVGLGWRLRTGATLEELVPETSTEPPFA